MAKVLTKAAGAGIGALWPGPDFENELAILPGPGKNKNPGRIWGGGRDPGRSLF